MRALWGVLYLLVSTPSAAADGSRTVSAGEPIWTETNQTTEAHVVYTTPGSIHAGNLMTGMIDVPAGTELLETPSKDGLRICQSFNSPSMFTTIKPCFVDDNKDGQFDRWSFNPNGKLISLKTTIPYSKHLNETAYRDAFTKVVVYQGATPSTLSLSYREFSGGIARPAFTEDLSIPLSANFPQEVRFKNVRIEIDAISGIGLTYRLLPSS